MPSNRKRTINQKSNSRSKLYLCSHLYQKQPIALQMNPRRTRKRSTSTIHYTCIKQKAQKIVKRKGEKKLCFHTKEHWENVIVNYLIVIRGTELTEGNESDQKNNSKSQRDAFRFSHFSPCSKIYQNPRFIDDYNWSEKMNLKSNRRTKILDLPLRCVHTYSAVEILEGGDSLHQSK